MKLIKNYEDICCSDVMQYVFDLNSSDLEVYKKLKELKESRADDLAKKIGKERSNVYRSLQKLTFCNLCKKTTRKIETGGYYHLYIFKSEKEVRKEIESCIDDWYNHMKKILRDFEKEMD
jgi:predicted transcriptional regulator